MRVGSTSPRSVHVSGFASFRLLTPRCRLYPLPVRRASALPPASFRPPSHPGRPCRAANTSPCRACRGLSPPRECALPGAQKARRAHARRAAKVMRDQAPRHLDPHHVLENTFPEIQAPGPITRRPRSAGPTGVSQELRRAVTIRPPASVGGLIVQSVLNPHVTPNKAHASVASRSGPPGTGTRDQGGSALCNGCEQVPFIGVAQSTRTH